MLKSTVPLPMTNGEWAIRLKRSRQSLIAWTHESKLPWVSRKMTMAIAEEEIDALEHYVPFMPIRMRSEVAPLVEGWKELRRARRGS